MPGDFAFGFRQVVPGGYLLAIWFDKIPEKTIVWSANRNNLAQKGSKIQLFSDGKFILNDPKGLTIWVSAIPGTGVAYGAFLDNGNLILASNTSAILWQNFNDPTDTLLPTQTLNKGVGLVSAFSGTNFSSGRFRFIMQNNGNLVLYTRNFPLDDDISAIGCRRSVGSGYEVAFNLSGDVSLSARNGTVFKNLSSTGTLSGQSYQRVILEYDGVLRHYIYLKSVNSSGGRSMAWSIVDFVPDNIHICSTIQRRRCMWFQQLVLHGK